MSTQAHRGLAPKDEELFSPEQMPALRAAAADLCWLLDRGYAARSSLELVGNRFNLAARQRMALSRYACTDADAQQRRKLHIALSKLRGEELWLDGYNVLTVLESALSGGVVLLCRDDCCRDIAGIHKRYRKVNETIPALRLVGEVTAALGVSRCRWWLDQPVSNSGRLKTAILETAKQNGWNMDVELTFSPDYVLSHTHHLIATSDGIVLDRCQRWVNLTRYIVEERIPEARVIDFSKTSNDEQPTLKRSGSFAPPKRRLG